MKKKTGIVKRILSVALATALVATSVQITAVPSRVVLAAPGAIETGKPFTRENVKDETIFTFYKIVANAQKSKDTEVLTFISEHTASEVISQYGNNDDYTKEVPGTYLFQYEGKIDFGSLCVSTIEGVGWAQNASEIDLSGVTLKTGALTEIPKEEFKDCKGLKKIVLPSTVTNIGDNAFLSCTSLVTLGIGTAEDNIIQLSKINVVGAGAFNGCKSIVNVDFDKYELRSTELQLGSSAFTGCTSIQELEIPIKDAGKMGTNVFENCSGLKKIGLQNDLQCINNATFKSAGAGSTGAKFYVIEEGEKDVSTLPKEITYIGEYAFQGSYIKKMDLSLCTKLTEFRRSAFASATFCYADDFSIEDATYEELEELYKQYTIVLPSSLVKICEEAFKSSVIYYLEVPESCTTIEKSAFEESTLYSIQLPKSLEQIRERTFFRCHYLNGEKIIFPSAAKLTTIGTKAFSECWDLGTTSFLKNLENLTTIENNAFSDCYAYCKINNSIQTDAWGQNLIVSGLEEVYLPDSVKTVGTSAFENNYALKKADLGAGLTNIPEKCFYNATANKNSGASLEQVILSKDIESIGDNAFANQFKLSTIGYKNGTDITSEEGTLLFGDSLVSIGEKAFYNCGAVYEFPSTTVIKAYIPKDKIYDSYAAGRYELIAKKQSAKEVEHIYVNKDDMLHSVAKEEQSQYEEYFIFAQKKYYASSDVVDKNSLNKNEYKVFPTDYTTTQDMYEGRFYAEKSSNSLYLQKPEEDGAQQLALEPGTFDASVFMALERKDFNLTNDDKTYGYSIPYFFGFSQVIIPDSVKNDNIGASAFENCVNLETVKLPKALTEIKSSTFSGCAGMYPTYGKDNNPKSYDYFGLRTINMPDTLLKIGNSAFSKCSNLVLEDPDGIGSSFGIAVEEIGNSAFADCVSLDKTVFPSSLLSIGDDAFARCTFQEEQNQTLTYTDGKTVNYKLNMKEYGTKEKKTGLSVVDFKRANHLESIGSGAFQQTNITTFDLTNTKVKEIKTTTLQQCTYLNTARFPKVTESLASQVFKDNIYLENVKVPISSTLTKDSFSGVYGTIEGNLRYVSHDPALELEQPDGSTQSIPIGKEYQLNINAVNKDTLYNNALKISVIDGTKAPVVIFNTSNGEIETDTYRGLSANMTYDEKAKKYVFSVIGSEYIETENPVTLRIEFATGFQILQSSSHWQSSQTIDYKISVINVPTESVSLSAAEDNIVKNNPNMYVESNGQKSLYFPSAGSALSNGIRVQGTINPAETTEKHTWKSSDPSVVGIKEGSETNEAGVSSVILIRKGTGNAKITLESGTKSDSIDVYCQTSGTVSATPSGDNLPANLNTSAQNPYAIPAGNGGKDQLVASIKFPDDYDGVSGEKVIYVSSNPDIISVDEQGFITTKKASGDEVVSITVIGQASGSSKTYYFVVTDTNEVVASSITISGDQTVNIGGTTQLKAVVSPVNAINKEVEWQVKSGSDIVSVDADGNVTGLKKGTAKIIAISKENSNVKSAEFTVKVLAPATSIQILDGSITLEEGKTYSISKTTSTSAKNGYVVTPSDTDDTVVWTSSNASVVSVKMSGSRAYLTANAPGTATLTATATSGVTASISVTIVAKKISVTGISITKEVTLNVGQTHTLTPTVLPANANEAVTYTYSSNNQKVATVDANGVIRAVGPGTASITAKTNTNRSAYCTVTVKQPAKSIKIYLNKPSVKKVYMAKGQTLSIKAEKNPLTSTDTLTYKSNKKKVAQVSSTGMITAKGKGTAKITIQATSGKKATITVVVSKKQVKAKKVKVKGPSSMKRKQTKKLTVSLVKAKSTDTLSFFSSNSSIASVDSYGYVKGIKKGTVKITVQASSGKKAVKKIKIK